jgi:hypothetical protein
MFPFYGPKELGFDFTVEIADVGSGIDDINIIYEGELFLRWKR